MPSNLILTTVGTSSLQSDKLNKLGLLPTWKDVDGMLHGKIETVQGDQLIQQMQGISALGRFVDSYLEKIKQAVGFTNDSIAKELNNPKNKLPNCFSAEFSSLFLLLSRSDLDPSSVKVTLLLSDSPDGVVCGLINQHLLQANYGLEVELRVVEGLQTDNFEEFYQRGLKSFLNLVSEQSEGYSARDVWLNITGGFKSLIPYCTYLSFAYDHPLFFVFEEQPVPVEISLNQLGKLTPWDKNKISDTKKILRGLGSDLSGILHPPGVMRHGEKP